MSGAHKHTDLCTRSEMVTRFDEEISRAYRNEYEADYISQVRDNKLAFLRNYAEMGPVETIAEFERRRAGEA